MAKNHNTAVLVGRTNVGKSTIFNRLLEKGEALTSPESGTTRDANLGQVFWRGEPYWLVDTAGDDVPTKNDITTSSLKHLQTAIDHANVILLVIDAKVGLLPDDIRMAQTLRRTKKNVILVINKVDNPKIRQTTGKLTMGFKEVVQVSAKNGSGLGDLLDLMIKYIKPAEVTPGLTLGIIGRTNVGKSCLFNQMLKKERSIVSPEPHTTRDRQRDYMMSDNLTIELIDTAGVRRQLKKAPDLEQQSVEQTQKTLRDLSAVILVVDGSQPFSWQDQYLADWAAMAKKPCLIVVNKLDIISAEQAEKVSKTIRAWLPMLSWAPHLFVSALKGQNCHKIIPLIQKQLLNFSKQLTPAEITILSNYFRHARATKDLPLGAFDQTGIQPPSFILKIKTKENLPKALGKWVEGVIRAKFDFTGTPIHAHVEGQTKLHHKHAE